MDLLSLSVCRINHLQNITPTPTVIKGSMVLHTLKLPLFSRATGDTDTGWCKI